MATSCSQELDTPPSSVSTVNSDSSRKYFWELKAGDINCSELALYIKHQMPPSNAYQSNSNVKCYFCIDEFGSVDHKIKRTYRECTESHDCKVIYRVDSCVKGDICRIEQDSSHDHNTSVKYSNTNGIHLDIKKAIETILEHNPTKYPK